MRYNQEQIEGSEAFKLHSTICIELSSKPTQERVQIVGRKALVSRFKNKKEKKKLSLKMITETQGQKQS